MNPVSCIKLETTPIDNAGVCHYMILILNQNFKPGNNIFYTFWLVCFTSSLYYKPALNSVSNMRFLKPFYNFSGFLSKTFCIVKQMWLGLYSKRC